MTDRLQQKAEEIVREEYFLIPKDIDIKNFAAYRIALCALTAGIAMAAPQLDAQELQILGQIRNRSITRYQNCGDEQDGFALAELDVAWLLDYMVSDAALAKGEPQNG